MSDKAARVLSIALTERSISDVMAEEREVFGPVYSEIVDYISDYSTRYKEPPTTDQVNEKFGEDLLSFQEGNIKYELDIMRQDYVRSQLDDMLVKLAQNIHKRPVSEVLQKMIEKGNTLQGLTTSIRDIDVTDLELAVETLNKARQRDEDGSVGIMTGIDAWDAALPMGMMPGQSITLMGYSGRGKSYVADKIIIDAFKQGKTVLLGSFEMSADEQRSRLYAILAEGGFLVEDLERGVVSEKEMRAWGEKALKTGGKIIVVEQEGHNSMTPSGMQAKIDKHRPDLVVMDYLQLMQDNARTKEMTPKMMNLSREIKQMATSNKVVCISITAVTDDETKKRDSPPRMAQIAWSKAIEYDSDLVVVVHLYVGTPQMEIISRKSRRSAEFGMLYYVDLSRGLFEAMTGEEDDG